MSKEMKLSKTEKRILDELNDKQSLIIIKDVFTNCETFYDEDIECRLDTIKKLQSLINQEIEILNELTTSN